MYLVDQGVVFQFPVSDFEQWFEDEKYDPLKDRVEEEMNEALRKLISSYIITEDELECRFRNAMEEGDLAEVRLELIRSVWNDIKDTMSIEALHERYRVDVEPETLGEHHVHNEEGGAFDLDANTIIPCIPCKKEVEQYLEQIDASKEGREIDDQTHMNELFQNVIAEGLGDEMKNLQDGDLLVINNDGSMQRIPVDSQEYEDRMNMIKLMSIDVKDMHRA